ncbi:MAG: threonylcarbamoyl-AMP synthase [Acutalibacter sp.]|nr:threonylcarbamoyl-AMP synthase [Acutalibacter sp.]
MNTFLLNGQHTNDIERAGEILRHGGLVAIPTETVYGLAANALDSTAVKKIFAAKGRPADNPLIVHVAEFSQIVPLVQEVPEAAKKLAEAFWPGPLTIILPKSELIPPETSGGLFTVAVRCPAHPVARAVIQAAGVPLAAPSANPSGRPSPTAFAHVKQDLTGKVDALLDGGDCRVGVESTVITLAAGKPRILRPGGVTPEELRTVLGEVEIDSAVLKSLEQGRVASSPGMKYKHYAPKADLTLVDASPEEYSNYVNQKCGSESGLKSCYALCFEEDTPLLTIPYLSFGSRYDSAEQAQRLFSSLYRLDALGVKKIYAHMPRKQGVGLAVYNRLIRAAGFSVVRPQKKMIVGLTGPSGAGKSTAAKLLEEAGLAVIDCDKLTRSPEVYTADCVAELQRAFGQDIAADGVLDRRLLAERAFADPDSKKRLEEIAFPYILTAVRQALENAFATGKQVAALDAPTLFESGLDSACARILVITAPFEERLERICKRDGIPEKAARQRFSAQHPEEFFGNRADWVVENRTGADLEAELALIIRELQEESGEIL